MQVAIANSQKLYNTLITLYPNTIFWNTDTPLYQICDNTNITHIIGPEDKLSLPHNKKCLQEYNNIKVIPNQGLENGVDSILIERIQDIKISGEYLLYIDSKLSDTASKDFMLNYISEKCQYNVRMVGPNKIYSYKYIGYVDDISLLNLIKHSLGCVDYFAEHIYDIAYFGKPCITMIDNPLFTNELEYSKIKKANLPTIIDNLKKILNNDCK